MEKKAIIVSFVILALLAVGGSSAGIYYYAKYQAANRRLTDPKAEGKDLLAKLSKLMDLPQGEEPTVATVTNADQIKNQPFFAKAKNGNRVIVYQNARLAILFDDQANKIINFGALNITATPSGTQPVATPQVSPTTEPLQ
jgi:hypothetical protein